MIGGALPLAKYIGLKRVNIYDAIFILHSKFTMVILLTFTLLLSAKQYFGDPIKCMTDMKFTDFVHSYCWTIGNFLVTSAIEQSRNTIAVGVGPSNKKDRFTVDVVYLRYYQWVVIVLFLEAVLFYLPAYLWKRWEGNRLVELCSPVAEALIPNDTRIKHSESLVSYFNSDNSRVHGNYMIKYMTCDLLNLIISSCNIFFLDYFLNGFWTRYIDVLSTLPLNDWKFWDQKASQIFPKLAKCTIYTFGLGGSINNHDALCMLPLNVINEKIFVFLWLWYTLMLLLASLKLLYHVCILASSPLRVHLLRLRARSIPYTQIREILKRRTIGDWFVMYKVSLNVNSLFFKDFLIDLNDSRRPNIVKII